MNILAFDIGGTAIKSAMADGCGNILSPREHTYTGGAAGVMAYLHATCTKGGFDAIAISTAGLVDPGTGSIIYCSDAILGYSGTPLKGILESAYKKPVFVINDVNAAALGEAFYGGGRDFSDFLCLTYGTGVGGAIVIDKKVYGGKSGIAGELGHIVTHHNGLTCVCGRRGCYGEYASATALVNRCCTLSPSLSNGREIFKAFHQGNQQVAYQVDQWIDEIVLGLVSAVHIFNPSLILLGGGIMAEKHIVEQVSTRLADAVMPGYGDFLVNGAYLGNHAGLMGAARYSFERCL